MLAEVKRIQARDLLDHFWTPVHSVSRPGELHPQPLAERCVSLSTHTAPIKQTRQPSLAASAQTDVAAASRFPP